MDLDPAIEVQQLLSEGAKHGSRREFPESESCYRRAAAIDPMRAEAYHGLASLAIQCGNGREALKFSEMALTLNADNAHYHFSHGMAQGMLGNLDYAASAYQRALKINPHFIQAMMNLIFTTDLHPSTTPEHALALRRQFDERFGRPYTEAAAAEIGPHKNRPDPERRLRVGYVSGDFRAHSAAAAFAPIVLNHDREQFEVYLYSTLNPAESEAQRNEFRAVSNWRDIEDVEPGMQAQAIAEDRIDILVDLSGFSGGSALQAFAARPAPVQVSAWGYLTGTGMVAMDYLFADDVTIPDYLEHHYSEQVVRLPAVFPYAHELAPDIREPSPFVRNGYATYGYLGRGTKITYATLDAWARVLRADPTSRMVVKSDSYRQKEMYRVVMNGLLARGIDNGRLTVLFGTARDEHLMAHNEVDVILDTVPQTGGISTCDALLMGVPVVTLAGQRSPERVSASILTSIGRPDLVTMSLEAYVKTASAVRATTAERQAIRKALGRSPLLDHPSYVNAVEAAYRAIWRLWCAKAAAGDTQESIKADMIQCDAEACGHTDVLHQLNHWERRSRQAGVVA